MTQDGCGWRYSQSTGPRNFEPAAWREPYTGPMHKIFIWCFTQAFEASMMAAADIFCAVSRSPSAAILKRYHLLFSTSIFSDESNNNGSIRSPIQIYNFSSCPSFSVVTTHFNMSCVIAWEIWWLVSSVETTIINRICVIYSNSELLKALFTKTSPLISSHLQVSLYTLFFSSR